MKTSLIPYTWYHTFYIESDISTKAHSTSLASIECRIRSNIIIIVSCLSNQIRDGSINLEFIHVPNMPPLLTMTPLKILYLCPLIPVPYTHSWSQEKTQFNLPSLLKMTPSTYAKRIVSRANGRPTHIYIPSQSSLIPWASLIVKDLEELVYRFTGVRQWKRSCKAHIWDRAFNCVSIGWTLLECVDTCECI